MNEDPYYNIEDEDKIDNDDELYNEVKESTTADESVSTLRLIGLMFAIMTGPVEGWKSLRRGKYTPDEVSYRLLCPLAGAAALSDFVEMIYDFHKTLSDTMIQALGSFLTYFLGYFVAALFTRILLPKAIKNFSDTNFGKIYIMTCISTLAFFHILNQLLPMLEPVLFFLPLWTGYIIVRGMKFIKVPNDKHGFTAGVFCLTIIGAPYLISWAYSFI